MNKKIAIASIAAASFAIGLFSGLALGISHVPASAPPDWLFSEFKSIAKPCASLQNVVQSRPDLWREINAELYSLKPQIERYREKLREIDDDFNNGFNSILSESQRARLCEAQNQKALPKLSPPKPEGQKPPQVAQEKQPRLPQESSDGLVGSMIFVPFTQERFTQVLELDEVQQAMLHDLLTARRDRFLKLSDDTPPPSSQLQRIADIIRRAEAASKQAPAK
ncbi:MAG: hypothetical protein WC378_04190 [Opitutaceae bacterium]|jgi:hypothetical protein